MVAIDLFCGKGGWTNGLIEAGFTVYGFDISPQPEYRGIFVQCDILALTSDDLRKYGPSFATCSSPCEEFSVHGLRCFHPNPKYPKMGLRLFNHSRELLEELGIPYVMENVRAAQAFVGRSHDHCGPYHLWGTGIPALWPYECRKVSKGFNRKWNPVTRERAPEHKRLTSNMSISKGMDMGSGKAMLGMSKEERRLYRKQFPWVQAGSKSTFRKECTAQAAMIPIPVARAVAETAKNLLLVTL